MGWPPRGSRRACRPSWARGRAGGATPTPSQGEGCRSFGEQSSGVIPASPVRLLRSPAALNPPQQQPFPEGDAAPSSHRDHPQFTFLSHLAWPQRRRTQPHPRRQKTPMLSREASQRLQEAVPRASRSRRPPRHRAVAVQGATSTPHPTRAMDKALGSKISPKA